MGIIAGDAIHKFKHLENVDENIVMWVAAVGIFINGFTAWLFMKGQKEDLNIKGAFLHMAADAAVALGVVIAGFIIKLTHFNWIDPVMCFIIIIVVVWGTWELLKDSVNLALDAVPESVDIAKVTKCLKSVDGIKDVFDLHIWGMSTTQTALSVHCSCLQIKEKTRYSRRSGINYMSNLRSRIHYSDHPPVNIQRL